MPHKKTFKKKSHDNEIVPMLPVPKKYTRRKLHPRPPEPGESGSTGYLSKAMADAGERATKKMRRKHKMKRKAKPRRAYK